jgi:hypothetical protein
MNLTVGRSLRKTTELVVIALVLAAVVTASLYASASPDFDHPVRGENAWRGFVIASVALSGLCSVAGWVLWLAWRRRAAIDAEPDAPARLVALAVATLPEARRDWGRAMTAELSSLTHPASRWSFAAGSARAALFPPAGAWRPATGWAGAAVGLLGVVACTAAAVYMLVVYPTETVDATPPFFGVVLVVVLASCLALTLVAPPALTSSPVARRVGIWLGAAAGGALLLSSRTGVLEAGAMTFLVPVQLLTLAVAPTVVATVTRSLRAAVQTIVWGFVFSTVAMFPVYIAESVRRYKGDGGLYLDGDADPWTTIGTNLPDAVGWLLILIPSLLVPLGILAAALVTAVDRAIERPSNRPPTVSA